MRLYLTFIVSLFVLGCAQVPRVTGFGPYFQMYMDEIPIVEISRASSLLCESDANTSIQLMDANSKQQIINGRTRLVCSVNTKSEQLKYATVLREVATGVRSEIRFNSRDACLMFKPKFNGNGVLMDCPLRND